jgi:hypothetical protein
LGEALAGALNSNKVWLKALAGNNDLIKSLERNPLDLLCQSGRKGKSHAALYGTGLGNFIENSQFGQHSWQSLSVNCLNAH